MNALERLSYLIQTIPTLLDQCDEASFSEKPDETKWSKKEVLGHLIDSASINHQRFVRAQFEDNPVIKYAQEDWCRYNYYQAIAKAQLVLLWRVYNQQLIELISNIPQEALSRLVNDLTLAFLIEDYVVHLEHHLRQIVDYDH